MLIFLLTCSGNISEYTGYQNVCNLYWLDGEDGKKQMLEEFLCLNVVMT